MRDLLLTSLKKIALWLWPKKDDCSVDVESIQRVLHFVSIVEDERQSRQLIETTNLRESIDKLVQTIAGLSVQLEEQGRAGGSDSGSAFQAPNNSGDYPEIAGELFKRLDAFVAKLDILNSNLDHKGQRDRDVLFSVDNNEEIVVATRSANVDSQAALDLDNLAPAPMQCEGRILSMWLEVREISISGKLPIGQDVWGLMQNRLGIEEDSRDFRVIDAIFALIRIVDNETLVGWYVVFHPTNDATTNNTFMHFFEATPPIQEDDSMSRYILEKPAEIMKEANFDPSREKLDRVELRIRGRVKRL